MMENFSQEKAMSRYEQLAKKYNLRPSTLKDVIKGKARGLSHKEIAEKYGHNKNTITRYSRALNEEFSSDETVELLFLVGIILGGIFLLKRILED